MNWLRSMVDDSIGLVYPQSLCPALYLGRQTSKGKWAGLLQEGKVRTSLVSVLRTSLPMPPPASQGTPSRKRLWIMATRGQTCLKCHQPNGNPCPFPVSASFRPGLEGGLLSLQNTRSWLPLTLPQTFTVHASLLTHVSLHPWGSVIT